MQLHPGALYLLGAVYLTGDCVKRDIASAMWCFHRASEKVAYGRDQQKIILFYLHSMNHIVISVSLTSEI
jgi:hypothetical protein